MFEHPEPIATPISCRCGWCDLRAKLVFSVVRLEGVIPV